MNDDFVSWGSAQQPPRARRWIVAAFVLPILLMGVAATTRAVLDLDLWRHSGQRARDIAAQPGANPADLQRALVSIQFDALAHADVLLKVAEQQDAAGAQARTILQHLRNRIR